MHRFFVTEISGDRAYLSKEDAQHAYRVLRLHCGDCVCLCDGCGHDYDGEIISADKDEVLVCVSNMRDSETESRLAITLFQCMPKQGKPEVIIQKCVELGVRNFIFTESERTVVRLDEKSFENKCVRYNKVAYEAAKQSERGIIPHVDYVKKLDKCDFSGYDTVIMPYENEREYTLRQLVQDQSLMQGDRKIAVIIGPEGGFTEDEVTAVREKGGHIVTLGKRILRTETAGMATVAMLMGLAE